MQSAVEEQNGDTTPAVDQAAMNGKESDVDDGGGGGQESVKTNGHHHEANGDKE